MHEAQHVALIPGVEHAEVVRDIVGALLPLGRAQLLRQGATVTPSNPGGLPPALQGPGRPCSPNLSFSLSSDKSDNFQSVSYSKTPPPSAGQGQARGCPRTTKPALSGNSCPLCFPTPLGLGLGTYRRAGVPRGVWGKWGCLARGGWGGAGAGPLASLGGNVEELQLEEPCEERAVTLQPPGNERAVRRGPGPWRA